MLLLRSLRLVVKVSDPSWQRESGAFSMLEVKREENN